MLETAKETNQRYVKFATDRDKEGLEEIAKAGMAVRELSQGDLATWRKQMPDLVGLWVKDLEAKGLGDRARVIGDRFRALAAEVQQ